MATDRKLRLAMHRLSYMHVLNPSAVGDGKPKYNVTVLIPKDHPDVRKIDDLLDSIYADEREATFMGKKFDKIANPLKDGDEYYEDHPDNPEYKGCYYLRLSSDNRPALFDENGDEVIDPEDIKDMFYSGCYGIVIGAGYAYNYKKTKQGFGFFLNGIKFKKDGERLGGYSVSADDFEDDEPRDEPRSKRDRDKPPARERRGSSRDDDRDEPRRESRRPDRSRDRDDDRRDSRSRRDAREDDDYYEDDEPRRESRRPDRSRDRDRRDDPPPRDRDRRGSSRRDDRDEEEDELYID